MARIRSIKPEFPQSESMGRVSRDARLAFIMLWTVADDEGRLRGNSRMLASILFPYDDDAKRLMDKWLAELESEHCIIRYTVDGDSYIQIAGWKAHQKIDKPSLSKLPKPPEDSRTLANAREDSPLEGKGREGKGEDQGREAASGETSSPPAIAIPLIDKSDFAITQGQVDEWVQAYPAVDVMQQLREMRSWSLANASKRKTRRGVHAFIVRWLSGEQDKGGKPRDGRAASIGVTVPGPTGPDPVLEKMRRDEVLATRPPAVVRELAERLKVH